MLPTCGGRGRRHPPGQTCKTLNPEARVRASPAKTAPWRGRRPWGRAAPRFPAGLGLTPNCHPVDGLLKVAIGSAWGLPVKMMGFTIQRWAAWAPGLVEPAAWEAWLTKPHALPAEGTPALTEMPAMMRRRVDRLGRIALQASYQAHVDAPDAPVLFASRYGDLGRSVELLTQLARSEPLSPTSFSLSVHNAIGALYSIRAGTRPPTAPSPRARRRWRPPSRRRWPAGRRRPPGEGRHLRRAPARPHAALLRVAGPGVPACLGLSAWPPARARTRSTWTATPARRARGATSARLADTDGLPLDLRVLRFLVTGAAGASRWEHPVGPRRWRWERMREARARLARVRDRPVFRHLRAGRLLLRLLVFPLLRCSCADPARASRLARLAVHHSVPRLRRASCASWACCATRCAGWSKLHRRAC